MSSRALRRLERQKEKEVVESEVSDSEVYQPVKKSNMFALMGGDDDDDDEDDESDEQKEEDKEIEAEVIKPISQKKKKKNKKKKSKESKEPTSDEELDQFLADLSAKENKPIDTTTQEYQDELEINITHPIIDSSFKYFTASKQLKSAELLKINVKDLDPDNEFKQLFGKLSIEAIQDAESTTSTSIPPEQLQQIKKLAKVIRGWGGRDRRSIPGTTRKLILTKIRDDWIPTQKKDMTMEELSLKSLIYDQTQESEDWEDVIRDDINQLLSKGIKFFKFERSDDKISNSQFYQSVVVTPNHENLMALLSRYPYHVETILQVALIFIRQGDKSNSNGLVERALFAFDRAFKQNFELFTGLNRLPYNYYLNRQFYLVLFRYIEVLTKKGTYGTALTYSKVLLSLSPAKDPLGVRYFIDFYAILSKEYQYLIDFVASPLVKTYKNWFTPGLAYSTVLAHLKLNQVDKAKEALKVAYIDHPFMGYKLLESIGLANDIPVKDHSIFEVGEEVELSTEAYLLRAPIIWNESKDREFLHNNLLKIVNEDIKLYPQNDFTNIPENFLRFAILSGEGKIMSKIPSEIWENNDIYEFDILPPKFGNVETLEDFIDERVVQQQEFDDDRLMEMVRNMSLQEMIDNGVHVDDE